MGDGHTSMLNQVPMSERFSVWWHRRETRAVILIWLVMTIVLCAFAWVPAHLMGTAASPTMVEVEDTMTVFTFAAAPVAALVWAVALYSLVKWRHQGKEQPPDDGPAMRTNGPATTLWMLGSSVLCIFLLVWGLAEMQSVAEPATSSSNRLVVDVTGQQWLWTFTYPQNGNVESDQLYLPVNRPVLFRVHSEDVIHSFWVVEMGIKVDANPGATTETSVLPDRVGLYHVRCAELCGLLHADMETYAHVEPAQQFSSWIVAQGGTHE